MFSRPFRMLGRSALAAGIISLGALGAGAQTAAAPPAGPNPSRVDIFLGYSYYGAHGVVKPANIRYSSIDIGAIGSGAFWFNKYVGAEISYSNHPDGQNDGLSLASAGPIFRAPMQNFTLFAHAHAGAGRLGGPNNEGTYSYHEPYRWGAALKAGGGMDYDLPFANHLFGLRLFQADYTYVHANFGPYSGPPPVGGALGGRANLSGVELSTGILMHFGHIIPPPPVTLACAASPATVYPGDPVTVTATPTNLNPKKDATYSWSADGGAKVSGTSATANVDTASLAPGSYNVKGHVSQGTKPGQFADCAAPFSVKAFEPPTVTCSASPSSIKPGDSSTITAAGSSPQNRPLTYSYSASAGSVSGTGTSATLSSAGAGPGMITVTCNVVDDKGQTASSTTSVSVEAPPAPVINTSSLCTVSFDRDKRRPVRVDNEAKACLDDVALSLNRDSSSKVALVGNGEGKHADQLASDRAINTKDYLVKEKGIDASRVTIYTGTDGSNTVTTTLIPAGANYTATGTPVDETKVVEKSVHHKKHKK